MGTFMASIAFRRTEQTDWTSVREHLKRLFDGVEGLVNNLDAEGPGYAIVSPYGEMGMFLGEYAPQVSRLLQGYAVMTVCNDSDFVCLTVYHDGEQVENCCVGELYEEFSEFKEVTPPRPGFWKQLMPEDTQPDALQEALFAETGFAEDNLRMLSRLTGMPIFDDHLVYELMSKERKLTDMPFDTGFGMMFGGFNIMFSIVFILVIGVFVVVFVKGISQWNKNNHSPRLTVDAMVVTKRMNVSRHHHGHAGDVGVHHTSSTSYYVTFQVPSGDRMELHVSGTEYGMLVEGDRGKLSFQGTRYLGFERM